MPIGFRKQLKGRFASMPDEEINTTQVAFLLKNTEAFVQPHHDHKNQIYKIIE
jgi:hypothetical protein